MGTHAACPRGRYGDLCLKHESKHYNELDTGRRQPMNSLQVDCAYKEAPVKYIILFLVFRSPFVCVWVKEHFVALCYWCILCTSEDYACLARGSWMHALREFRTVKLLSGRPYSRGRVNVQCMWRKFLHKKSTCVLYVHRWIFVTAHTLYVQVHKVVEENLHKHSRHKKK